MSTDYGRSVVSNRTGPTLIVQTTDVFTLSFPLRFGTLRKGPLEMPEVRDD